MGEGYLEKVGRLNAARFDAESEILREMILIPTRTTPRRREPGRVMADTYRAIQRLMDEENDI